MAPPGWSLRVGLTAALGVVLAVLAAIALGLADPWWAAISAWMVWTPDRRALLDRAAQRVAGTLAGAVSGYVLAEAAAGQAGLQAVLLFAVGAIGTRLRFTAGRFAYGWFYLAITMTLVLVQSLSGSGALEAFAVARCLEILCGVVVATLVDAVLGRAPPEGPLPPAAAWPAAEVARAALVGGCAMVLVPLLWRLFELPSVVQMAVTALVLVDRDLLAQRLRAGQRIRGGLAGAALGLGLLGLGLNSLPIWLTALGGGLVLFSPRHHGGGPEAYVGTQGGLALIMALVSGSGPPATVVPALGRLAGILLGVALVAALSAVLAKRSEPRAPA